MARPFTPRIARLVACPEMWHHYVLDRATIAKAKRLFLRLCGYRLSCHSLRMGVTLKLLSHEGGQFIPVILQVIQHR